MKTLAGTTIWSAALAGLLLQTETQSLRAAELGETKQPIVEIAILLDTSNSMDGLIDQAKGQLWKIVNKFIKAKQNGRAPEVHVALFEYGKSSLPSSEGYIRLIEPLTNDLDRISEDLFALKTNGGDEYCGWVIKEAAERLTWSDSPNVYKAIFIAGNEPFTQGPVKYAESCKMAIAKGIIVNTIHCGAMATGINTKWQDGALLADGKYMVIDQNRAIVDFESPQDKELARLNAELNKTYIAYGVAGQASAERQLVQDANASSLASAGSLVNRVVAKASVNYRNDSWDLVDALNNGTQRLADIKNEELPVEMQKMTEQEQKEFIEAKSKEREEIQQKIQKLNEERTQYISSKMKAQAATNTLDTVMISTIREQAQAKNYRFE